MSSVSNLMRTRLPMLTMENLNAVMAERLAATKNQNTVIPLLWQGYLELPLSQGRTAAYYIPQDTPQGTTVIAMNIPEGEETLSFWKKSGWLELADKERFCLYALEPGKDGWGSPAAEAFYLREGLDAVKLGQYLLLAFSVHLVGYGPIGTELHKLAMADPLHTAAGVFFDASDVDRVTLQEYREKEYVIPDTLSDHVLRVPYRTVPLPVWIASEKIDAATTDTVAYWKAANIVGECTEDSCFGTVYSQMEESIYTPEGKILKLAVHEKRYDPSSPETTALACRFLLQYYRYGMGPRSNQITRKVSYTNMGLERLTFTDKTGVDREALIYVPKKYRNGEKKLSAVFAFHGASQSMRNMMENGLWYHLAEEKGLVAVFPESTLQPMPEELHRGLPMAYRPLWMLFNPEDAPKDAAFVEDLIDRVEENYPIDINRLYSTGHSMGCMLTNYLGSSRVGCRFAAIGGTSGILLLKDENGGKVPAFFTVGQYELWPYDLKTESGISDMVKFWIARNMLNPETYEVLDKGRWHTLVWRDSEGTPWLCYTVIADKHHVHTYEENCVFWDEWFSHWELLSDGNRRFSK